MKLKFELITLAFYLLSLETFNCNVRMSRHELKFVCGTVFECSVPPNIKETCCLMERSTFNVNPLTKLKLKTATSSIGSFD